MTIRLIAYLFGTALSLYMAYLFTYYLYTVPDYYDVKNGREPDRIVMSRIAYVLIFALCFAPGLNLILPPLMVCIAMIGRAVGDFQIKSWLFEKPEVKADNTDDNPEKK